MVLTPRALIEEINALSDEYYEKSQEMATIAEKKGTAWLELRSTCKTNAEANALWDASELGRRENYLKWYLKGLEKKRGARLTEYRANSNQLI